MSTQAKLDKILQTKNEIKAAIIAKGVEVSDTDTFASFATKIASIQASGFLNDDFIEFLDSSLAYLWYKRTITKDVFDFIKENITSFKNFDYTFCQTTFSDTVTPAEVLVINLANAESLNYTFNGICNLVYNEEYEDWDEAAIPGTFTFNIPKIKSLDSTFKGSSLVNIVLNSSACTSFKETFYGCNWLQTLQCDFSKATSITNIINQCTQIQTIDFATTTNKLATISSDFGGCYSLENILNLNILGIEKYSFQSGDLNNFLSTANLKRLTFQSDGTRTNNLAFNISHFTKMTATGAVEMFNSLPASTATTTITLSATLYSSLTAEQIAIATDKGWTILSA